MKANSISLSSKSNILRAFVMSFNDGVISIAGLSLGVIAKTSNINTIIYSALAGIIAGMISMALGELASVSAESDSQKRIIEKEKQNLSSDTALTYLENKYKERGISEKLSREVSDYLLKEEPLRTVIQEKYGFDINDITNANFAAIASFFAFPLGSSIPLLLLTVSPISMRFAFTITGVLLSLIVIGIISSKFSSSSVFKVIIRNIIAGSLAMVVTYGVGMII